MSQYKHRQFAIIADGGTVSQGDVTFVPIETLPAGARPARSSKGEFIAAHSETGHHHIVDVTEAVMYEGSDPFRAYLVPADGVHTIGVHHTRHDADHHRSIGLACPPGTIWEVRRQREFDPAGERRAAD